jgi:D-alanyl-D-alanine carboxypeptidase/D-alanyl-D-alanine-endopeptidase (penicillin-binding protein 4)
VPRGDRRHVGRWWRRLSAGAVLLVLAAGVASYRLDLGDRRPAVEPPAATPQPATVPPPAGLALPTTRPAAAVARTTRAGAVDGDAVRRALAPLLRSRKLGPHTVVRVAELSDGRVVYRHAAGPVTPASTMKLLTSAAALHTLGPAHRFRTEVVATPSSPRIVLVGGGDPLLARVPLAPGEGYPARADLTTLARTTAAALRAAGRARVRLGYDATLFSGPAVNPRWEPSYVPDDEVSPTSALWVDEGRRTAGLADRSDDPAADAARFFADRLGRRGIRVVGPPRPVAAGDARTIASVRSAPLAQIVQHVLEVSDNDGAEVLFRQVALATGRPGSSVAGSVAVRRVLTRLGVPMAGDRIYDGSGLSRQDRLDPATLIGVLEAAADPEHPALRPVLTGLPVAGFTGSLALRFDEGDPDGLGTVRAKTGTLTGVHGLAGTVTTRDGALLAFVAVADRVRPRRQLDARVLVDRMAAALAGCACAAASPSP